jgi:murein DD-endopeptidase MepM/ murein hydrolase activator NlpD
VRHILRHNPAPIGAVLLALAGCASPMALRPVPTETPQVIPAPSSVMTGSAALQSPTRVPTQTPAPTPTTPPTPTTQPSPLPTLGADDHYWFGRPIGEGYVNYVDRTYPYGSTANGKYRTHHGVEFFNPRGTPILAVGSGNVIYAGDDSASVFGPEPNFYGKLVIYQLDQDYAGRPLYALNAHMSEVMVQAGQHVEAGEVIGLVGATGVANGSHLHFEVRVGDPHDYGATRNPELWLAPFYEYGTLAGRVVDASGTFLYEHPLSVYGERLTRFVLTYADSSVNPDDYWGENFVAGDLPAGDYRVVIKIGSKKYEQIVHVEPGRTIWVEFRGE